MNSRWMWLVLAALLLGYSSAPAMWLLRQTESVPISRLLTNLHQRLATNGQNAEVLYQLARVHSMAYATNLATLPVTKVEGEPVFAPPGSDTGVPAKVSLGDSPGARAVARRHLTNSIAYYERAARLVDRNPSGQNRWLVVPIHLGLAWCLDQDGRKPAAIRAYRKALQHAWRQEVDGEFTVRERAEWTWDQLRAGRNPFAKPSRGGLGPGVCFSDEIIGYLLKLLDPKADAKEIAQLEADRKHLRSMPRAVTPIVIPLTDRVALSELTDPSARVAFDLDGSGEKRRWGWITTNAAWLVFDHDGRGQITSGLQLFGNVTFWVFWRNGYEALASLDDDDDGFLRGEELQGLALWRDGNGNGLSEPGGVTAATALGVEALACRSDTGADGVPFNPQGVRLRDGRVRPSYDWFAPSR